MLGRRPAVHRALRARPNLTLATGHAMLGVALAPITGELVAQLLSDEKPSLLLEPFSPDRFSS